MVMKYIAVEMGTESKKNRLKPEINDNGLWCSSIEEAWDCVSGIFYLPNTIIIDELGKVYSVHS